MPRTYLVEQTLVYIMFFMLGLWAGNVSAGTKLHTATVRKVHCGRMFGRCTMRRYRRSDRSLKRSELLCPACNP